MRATFSLMPSSMGRTPSSCGMCRSSMGTPPNDIAAAFRLGMFRLLRPMSAGAGAPCREPPPLPRAENLRFLPGAPAHVPRRGERAPRQHSAQSSNRKHLRLEESVAQHALLGQETLRSVGRPAALSVLGLALVFVILSRVSVRVFERMLVVPVVAALFLLLGSAVAVFAGILLPLRRRHGVSFRRVLALVWGSERGRGPVMGLVLKGQEPAGWESRSRSCQAFVRDRRCANTSDGTSPGCSPHGFEDGPTGKTCVRRRGFVLRVRNSRRSSYVEARLGAQWGVARTRRTILRSHRQPVVGLVGAAMTPYEVYFYSSGVEESMVDQPRTSVSTARTRSSATDSGDSSQ